MAYKIISPEPVVAGGTGIQSATSYAPIIGGTTSTSPFKSASTGQSTTGAVFTSNGSSAIPTWNSSGGGNWTLIGTRNFAGQVGVSFTSIGGFATYALILTDVISSNSSVGGPVLQISSNNGSSYIASNYLSSWQPFGAGGPGRLTSSTYVFAAETGVGGQLVGTGCTMYIHGMNGLQGGYFMCESRFSGDNILAGVTYGFTAGINTISGNYNAIQLIQEYSFPTNPYTQGWASLYGISS